MLDFELVLNRQNVIYIGVALRRVLGKKLQGTPVGPVLIIRPRGMSAIELRRYLCTAVRNIDEEVGQPIEEPATPPA